MCLIIYAPKGQLVPRDVLSFAANQNSDGIGVMSEDGVHKYLGKKALKRARRYIESLAADQIPYAVHMRWATHGDINLDNTHPYKAPEGNHYIMHNGIISFTTAESSKAESDTAVYVRKYLHAMPDFEDTDYYKQVGTHIGYSNKFVIMDTDARFQVCNESQGIWIEGVWYSNTYSLPTAFVPRTNYSGGWWNGHRTGGMSDYDLDEWIPGTGAGSSTVTATSAVGTGVGVDNKAWKLGWKFCSQLHAWYDPKVYEVIDHKWLNGTTSKKLVKIETAEASVIEMKPNVEETGNKDYPAVTRPLLPRTATISGNIGHWPHEDRQAYYEALEAGLTPTEAAEYLDAGTDAGELAALRAMQGRVLAEATAPNEKEEAPPGGDFAEISLEDIEAFDSPTDGEDEEQTQVRTYLKSVAATLNV